jgi:hypothetical protein
VAKMFVHTFAAQAPTKLTPATTIATVIVFRNEYSIRLLPRRHAAQPTRRLRDRAALRGRDAGTSLTHSA